MIIDSDNTRIFLAGTHNQELCVSIKVNVEDKSRYIDIIFPKELAEDLYASSSKKLTLEETIKSIVISHPIFNEIIRGILAKKEVQEIFKGQEKYEFKISYELLKSKGYTGI